MLQGTPGDVVNVRMQNDIKLPHDLRRNYHHVIDGMRTIIRYEGVKALFSGTTMATSRAVLMTIGQLSVYDQFKHLLLTKTPKGLLEDDTKTHLLASLMAGTTATTLTQPLDVIKTRLMNETAGHYKGALDVAKSILRDYGPIGFFRGYVPAFVRLTPHTMFTFVFLEELRLHFGTPIYEQSPSEVVKAALMELDKP
jgi:dicarboxylate transporter 10